LSAQIVHNKIYSALAKPRADALWSAFITLNKITAQSLVRTVTESGFALVREYTTRTNLTPSDDLLLAYSRETLITEQIVALFRRA